MVKERKQIIVSGARTGRTPEVLEVRWRARLGSSQQFRFQPEGGMF